MYFFLYVSLKSSVQEKEKEEEEEKFSLIRDDCGVKKKERKKKQILAMNLSVNILIEMKIERKEITTT